MRDQHSIAVTHANVVGDSLRMVIVDAENTQNRLADQIRHYGTYANTYAQVDVCEKHTSLHDDHCKPKHPHGLLVDTTHFVTNHSYHVELTLDLRKIFSDLLKAHKLKHVSLLTKMYMRVTYAKTESATLSGIVPELLMREEFARCDLSAIINYKTLAGMNSRARIFVRNYISTAEVI